MKLKLVSLLTSMTLVVAFTTAAMATNTKPSAKYSCENEYGMAVKLEISRSPVGSNYDYQGTLIAPGADATTDIFMRSLKVKMVGTIAMVSGSEVFHLHDPKNPMHQIMAEIKEANSVADILELNLKTKEERTRKCQVDSALF